MKIRLSGLIDDSIVDGVGLRFSVFVQGCPHHCAGCHNPTTHDPAGGYDGDTEAILAKIKENPLLSGVTFSGGEPFAQPVPLAALAEKIKARGLNLWIYTGYNYETLQKMAVGAISPPADCAGGETDGRNTKNDANENAAAIARLLELADVLVDGPFILAEKDLTLPFRGSRNQRLIDLAATRRRGALVELEL